jgi:hypothetical protein
MEVSAEVGFSLGEKMDTLSAGMAKLSSDISATHESLVNPQKELISGGAGFVFADLGGPQDSFVWDVRRVTLGAVVGNALPTLGTSCFICKGSSIAPGNQFVVDVAPTIPCAATYGSGEFVLRSPHHLIIAWSGGTNTLFIDCDVAERPRHVRLQSLA